MFHVAQDAFDPTGAANIVAAILDQWNAAETTPGGESRLLFT
jgi:hypothetical protein